jgi:predicted acyltransferase
MGISCYISLVKSQFKPTKAIIWKIVKRTILLFLIGLFINWFHSAMKGQPLDFAHLRIWAVMQRIALCYFAVSLFALFVNHRYTLPTVALLLGAYTLLLIYGNGYSEDPSVNILARADRWLFGYDHLYHKSPVDPEGLLGTISSIAHVMLGFYCGKLIKTTNKENVATRIFVVGTVCIVLGYLLTYGLPLNKRIWSPSYVLVTCGLCALLQALFITEEEKLKNESFFKVFGTNALALYVLSELLSIVFSTWGINDAIYDTLHAVIPLAKWASLAYALVFVGINFTVGYLLYRNKIYIKL